MDDSGLLRAYFATTWTVHSPGGALKLRLTDAVHPGSPLRPGGVVTAYNPASLLRSLDENERASRELEVELRRAGAAFWPALARGTGADAARWTEPGFFLPGETRPLLVVLGARFGQNAVVWVDPDGVPRLIATRPGFCGRAPGEELRP